MSKDSPLMSAIRFKTKLIKIDDWTVAVLPKDVSAKLPSRGLAMVRGSLNGSAFKTALEPDGRRSHWLEVDKSMRTLAEVEAGDTVSLEIESEKAWTEPKVPADIQKGIADDSKVGVLWSEITPMARWEWIRWIRSTNSAETRLRRIEVARSKLKAGNRRPCCFNTSMCTVPEVSKNGVLLVPA